MTSWEERVGLEQGVVEAKRDREFNSIVLEQKEIALRHALEERDAALKDVRYHDRNRLFAKNQADVVSIDEYREILKQLEDSKDALETALDKVRRLSGEAEHYRCLVQSSERRISTSREVLGSYGKLIPFVRTQ